jgi:hypothetical protein
MTGFEGQEPSQRANLDTARQRSVQVAVVRRACTESLATIPARELPRLAARYVTNWCNKSAERAETGNMSRQTVENKARASKTDA